MAEDSRNKNDDDVELSEEGIKEVQRLEAKKTAKQKKYSTLKTSFSALL